MPDVFWLEVDYTLDTEAPTAVEQLDALPPLSIVVDRDGDVWQRRGKVWCSYGNTPCTSAHLLKYKPVGVVYMQFRPVGRRSASEAVANG
ncbi:hypothetical protein [Nocardia tengchongensis]|uniref:hypothetical protein n=1 Tax=Nocardia tengchongensis TaxID=2055889 RepID=UPI003699E195